MDYWFDCFCFSAGENVIHVHDEINKPYYANAANTINSAVDLSATDIVNVIGDANTTGDLTVAGGADVIDVVNVSGDANVHDNVIGVGDANVSVVDECLGVLWIFGRRWGGTSIETTNPYYE